MQPILTFNLSSKQSGIFKIPEEWERDFLGGASLGARILYDHLTAELDVFAPEAPLLMLTGPLSGTAGPAVGRFVVCGKSPLTGLWAESNCGGFWGAELRKTGFDGIWITGKANKPVYILVKDQSVELRDAASIWGKDTYEVQSVIKKEAQLSDVRVLGIGPAGENLIPFALLLCDHGRVAGRTGLGAVMGSKNLKAIGVKGTGKIPLFDEKEFGLIRSGANRELRNDSMTSVLSSLGSAGAGDYFNYLGEQPKKYFSTGVLEGAEKVSGTAVAETILVGKSACHGCVIACGRVVDLGDDQKRKGPEYETLVGFGPNLGIIDPGVATRMGELCDRYGIDVISMSGTIGLAFRLFEIGIINETDTGNLQLVWGNAEVVEECIHLTIKREGIGQWLAAGAKKFAEHFGAPDEAIQVNGLEIAYHDPRGASGMAIVYASSPRGACHNQSDYFLVDIGQVEASLGMEFYDRQAGTEKARNVVIHQNYRTINNALVLCLFANVPPETILNLINLACGYSWELSDLMRCGERSWNLKRLINLKLGLTPASEILPKPLLQPLTDGGSEGYVIPFAEMMEAYYKVREWNFETGYPLCNKLDELGLNGLAKFTI